MTGQTDWAASTYVDNKLHTTGLSALSSSKGTKKSFKSVFLPPVMARTSLCIFLLLLKHFCWNHRCVKELSRGALSRWSFMVLLSNTCFLVRRTSRPIEPRAAGHQVQDHLKEPEGVQVFGPWWDVSVGHQGPGATIYHIWENVAVQ